MKEDLYLTTLENEFLSYGFNFIPIIKDILVRVIV